MPVFFFVLWIIFNGKITAEIVLIGLPVTAAVTLFACRVLGYPLRNDLKILRNLPILLLYPESYPGDRCRCHLCHGDGLER